MVEDTRNRSQELTARDHLGSQEDCQGKDEVQGRRNDAGQAKDTWRHTWWRWSLAPSSWRERAGEVCGRDQVTGLAAWPGGGGGATLGAGPWRQADRV